MHTLQCSIGGMPSIPGHFNEHRFSTPVKDACLEKKEKHETSNNGRQTRKCDIKTCKI